MECLYLVILVEKVEGGLEMSQKKKENLVLGCCLKTVMLLAFSINLIVQ